MGHTLWKRWRNNYQFEPWSMDASEPSLLSQIHTWGVTLEEFQFPCWDIYLSMKNSHIQLCKVYKMLLLVSGMIMKSLLGIFHSSNVKKIMFLPVCFKNKYIVDIIYKNLQCRPRHPTSLGRKESVRWMPHHFVCIIIILISAMQLGKVFWQSVSWRKLSKE